MRFGLTAIFAIQWERRGERPDAIWPEGDAVQLVASVAGAMMDAAGGQSVAVGRVGGGGRSEVNCKGRPNAGYSWSLTPGKVTRWSRTGASTSKNQDPLWSDATEHTVPRKSLEARSGFSTGAPALVILFTSWLSLSKDTLFTFIYASCFSFCSSCICNSWSIIASAPEPCLKVTGTP